MLTDPEDLVLDPWAGSCVTGEVCERLERKWVCGELVPEYVEGARARFEQPAGTRATDENVEQTYYKVPRPGMLWNGKDPQMLDPNGGRKRPTPGAPAPEKPRSDQIVVWKSAEGQTEQAVQARLIADKKR